MNRAAPIRLLIVERRPIVREGICRLIAGMPDIELAAAVADSVNALRFTRQLPLDVVLLSTSIRGRGFFDTLKRIRAARPEVSVVVLGGRSESGHAARAHTMGASGYLSDDSATADLLAAVRTAHEERRGSAEDTADNPSDRHSDTPDHARLSHREYEVLCLMGAGRAVGAIAPALGLSVKTVSTYRSRLQRKLKLGSSAEIIRYAIEHNLVSETSQH